MRFLIRITGFFIESKIKVRPLLERAKHLIKTSKLIYNNSKVRLQSVKI